ESGVAAVDLYYAAIRRLPIAWIPHSPASRRRVEVVLVREEDKMIARMLYGADPFRDMRRLHNEMNQMAGRGTVGAPEFPAFNAYANQDGVVLTAELPGVKSEDLDISVHR